MVPKIIIVKPDITEEENESVLERINAVLNEIAHSTQYIEYSPKERKAQ